LNIITLDEARAAGLTRYFTGESCRNGHISEFQVSSKRCCECSKIKKRAKYQENLEASRAARRAYYAVNTERILENNSRSRAKNSESVLEGKKAWYDKVKKSPEWQEKQKAYRESKREAKRAYDQKYAAENSAEKVKRARDCIKANPDKRAAIVFSYDARRRSQKAQGDSTVAIGEWIRDAEKVCYWCRADCGDGYHVDHYYPLSKGGEHRITNLVIACPTCNVRKNAKDPHEFAASIGRLPEAV